MLVVLETRGKDIRRPLRTHTEAESVASEVEIVARVQLLIGLSFCGLT